MCWHILPHTRSSAGRELEAEWRARTQAYQAVFPQKYAELERRLKGKLPVNWESALPVFPADEKGMATRIASGKVINALAAKIPELIGGSADLAPSTKTWMDGFPAFEAETPGGRNFHFGVREHAMGAIVNGMAVSWWGHPLRSHLPDLCRLHARAHPSLGLLTLSQHLGFHPRQHRGGRGWTNPSAGGTTGLPAGHPEPGRDPPGGCQ